MQPILQLAFIEKVNMERGLGDDSLKWHGSIDSFDDQVKKISFLSINGKSVEVFYVEQIWLEGELVLDTDSRISRDYHTSLPSAQSSAEFSILLATPSAGFSIPSATSSAESSMVPATSTAESSMFPAIYDGSRHPEAALVQQPEQAALVQQT